MQLFAPVLPREAHSGTFLRAARHERDPVGGRGAALLHAPPYLVERGKLGLEVSVHVLQLPQYYMPGLEKR